ncbi:unnamed protein product, partial [Trichobilharzia regenti]
SNNHDESIDYSTTSKEKNTLPPIYSSKKNSCRSPEGSPSLKLKNYQFFNRFRMHSSKANGKTRSANNSPLLSSSFSPTMYRNTLVNKSSHSRTYSDCSPVVQPTNVKLIDTYLIKGPSGFGLTLTGVLTFIPNGMLDVHIVSDQFNTQDGFFQRLLQIRSVSDDVITCDNDLIQSHTKQPVIRPGDILLAAGGYRFAGCTPEYAVQSQVERCTSGTQTSIKYESIKIGKTVEELEAQLNTSKLRQYNYSLFTEFSLFAYLTSDCGRTQHEFGKIFHKCQLLNSF